MRSDDADGLAKFNHPSRGEVAAVALDTHAASRLASQHRSYAHALDSACQLNHARQIFGDLLVGLDDHFTGDWIAYVLEHHAPDDSVAEGFDLLSAFDDRRRPDAFDRSAVRFADDHVLSHVDQTPGEITRVGSLERGISQSLSCAVSRDEVLKHVQAFAEVSSDRCFDDFA